VRPGTQSVLAPRCRSPSGESGHNRVPNSPLYGAPRETTRSGYAPRWAAGPAPGGTPGRGAWRISANIAATDRTCRWANVMWTSFSVPRVRRYVTISGALTISGEQATVV
jgi:hypothetical protein